MISHQSLMSILFPVIIIRNRAHCQLDGQGYSINLKREKLQHLQGARKKYEKNGASIICFTYRIYAFCL